MPPRPVSSPPDLDHPIATNNAVSPHAVMMNEELVKAYMKVFRDSSRKVHTSELGRLFYGMEYDVNSDPSLTQHKGMSIWAGHGIYHYINPDQRREVDFAIIPLARHMDSLPNNEAVVEQVRWLVEREIEEKGYGFFCGEDEKPDNKTYRELVELCALGRLIDELTRSPNQTQAQPNPQPSAPHHIFKGDGEKYNVAYYRLDVFGKLSLGWHSIPWDDKFGKVQLHFQFMEPFGKPPYRFAALCENMRRRIDKLTHPVLVYLDASSLGRTLDEEVRKQADGSYFLDPQFRYSFCNSNRPAVGSNVWFPLNCERDRERMVHGSRASKNWPVLMLSWQQRFAWMNLALERLEKRQAQDPGLVEDCDFSDVSTDSDVTSLFGSPKKRGTKWENSTGNGGDMDATNVEDSSAVTLRIA